MFRKFKDNLIVFFNSRITVLVLIFFMMGIALIARLFYLQLIKGNEYLDNFNLKIKKEEELPNTRGIIYDKDGKELAYNQLVYSVMMEDNGNYSTLQEKNDVLNSQILKLIDIISANGDSIVNDFKITVDESGNYQYTVAGNELYRFLADVYGKPYINQLSKKEKNISANDLISYLCSKKKYSIGSEISKEQIIQVIQIRCGLSSNNYQKYVKTTVSENVSDKTKAAILENIEKFTGVSIEQNTIRKYNYSPYLSHILGYVGSISEDEINNYSSIDEKYDSSYVVGKSGIEKNMETQLQGTNGHRSFYVDNLGKVIDIDKKTDSKPGNDVYLSISADLQETIYHILEQRLAGILRSKLVLTSAYETRKITDSKELVTSIDEVYVQLINNNILNMNHFNADDASYNEHQVYNIWKKRYDEVILRITNNLSGSENIPLINHNEEYQKYFYEIVDYISSADILTKEATSSDYEPYKALEAGSISIRDYLTDCIIDEHVQLSKIISENSYADSEEIYNLLAKYIEEQICNDNTFKKLIYEYLILDKKVSGRQLCIILFDQNVIPMNNDQYNSLASAKLSAFDFIIEKISKLELTPAQLALDPCSASVVVNDVNTGKVLALVSYPSYDNNKMTNHIDSSYYSKLLQDQSLPLYNRATQQKTAPGSTFKMVSAVAGLEEDVIDLNTPILDQGIFTKVQSNNKCWIYPLNHGWLNVTSAIKHSCNYFFYEVGYRLGLTSTDESSFNDSYGITRLTKYATQFGLGEVSGLEIDESKPQIATRYPITAAIGQSNNNYTTSQLARYVSTIANHGNLYKFSLIDSVKNKNKDIILNNEPQLERKLELSNDSWSAIREGMKQMAASSTVLSTMNVAVAGKTGTAQEVKNRGDHALFVGYAPSDEPQIAIAVRIPYGYTSSNAVEVAKDVINYYLGSAPKEELITGQAVTPGTEIIHD